MSVKDPELVLEQRRIRVSRISDSSLQRIKIEYIGGEILDPISHETSSTSTILFHKIKRLQCFNNYNYSAYLSACKSKKRYALVTVVPNDTEKNWICHNRLISIDKKKDSNEGTENAGCLQVNCNSNQFCAKCHSQRNSCKMRPYFRILQRLSFTARDRRATVLKKIESIDDELARCFEAVKCIDILNKDKLPPNIRENIRNLTSIDLDLVQNNVLQRIEVAAMGPILKRLVEQKKEVLMRLWEECVIVTQLVYTMAVVHIQRYVRGFLPRSRLDKVRVLYIQRKQHVAAIDIQCMVRSYISKHALQNRLYQRKIAFITLLQCFFRQTIAKISRNSLALEIKRCLQIKAAVVVQKRIRKYIAQIYFASLFKLKQDEIAEKARSQTQHILTSAAIIIQTTFRRFIACQVLHLLQTESGLHPRIRFHAEKFLQKGRLWSFLWCLSEDFRRYERRIDEMLFEEEVNATTFINKVSVFQIRINCNSENNDNPMPIYYRLQKSERKNSNRRGTNIAKSRVIQKTRRVSMVNTLRKVNHCTISAFHSSTRHYNLIMI